eukprot:TRINITY_DN18479_c0_g1_i1.p2 TRINITY_DN18479_c0_g1~~TRINITY_DN18479_c0_g1_i1.p2  ORF type:complete len:134 (+),score=33.06 TRINITY_DN18479_c0_g1_i1:70-471(+)
MFKALLVALLCVALASSVSGQYTTFFDNISTFHSYQPYRVPPLPSITLPTIIVADTDDSAAPFALLTLSAFNNVPSFVLPPVSFFDASVFGNNGGDGNVDIRQYSSAFASPNSGAASLAASAAAVVVAVAALL